MIRVVGKQVAGALAALLVATFVLHSAIFVAPGDPVTVLTGGRELPPASIAAIRDHYGLDDPFFTRYATWMGGVLRGDLGDSVVYRQPVNDLISARLGNTLLLLAMATVIMVVGGVALGLLAGLRGRVVDGAARVLTSIGIAVPPFVAAILLTSVFAVSLGLFPVFGTGTGLVDRMYHLTLPAIALSAAGLAYVARVTRVSVRAEARQPHVETARARGLPEGTIVRRHIVRNALLPVTTVAGLTVAGTIAITVVVENAFTVNGLGTLLVDSVDSNDFAVVQGVSLVLVTIFVVVNLIVDLGYLFLDPRVRAGAKK